jgi:glycosyltransferase involved in cell wall biosynthesis
MSFLNKSLIVVSNLMDLGGLFVPTHKVKEKGLRILVFNWRDTKHLWAGGAEVYIHELSKRWAREGNSVTLFCGNDGQSLRNEAVDKVNIIRRGGFFTVYLWAILYTVFKFRNKFDVVIDSENGIPFFTPLFTTKPVILLVHHVHQEIFIEHMKFPLSYIGRFIEGKVMPFVYKNHQVITVSESSRKEIIKTGIAPEERVQIVNPGIEMPNKKFKKTEFPSVIYLGRLKAYKNVDIAIRAFSNVVKRFTAARFYIVGEGDSIGSLRDVVVKLGLEEKVLFLGKVSEEEKVRLLSESWVAVQPSTVEGWGITVIEANSCKTPVIASDTKGLRDSIIDGKTGILVKVKDTKAFSKNMKKLIVNKRLRDVSSKEAYKWAKQFSWDESAKSFYHVLFQEHEKRSSVFSLKKAGYVVNRITSLF